MSKVDDGARCQFLVKRPPGKTPTKTAPNVSHQHRFLAELLCNSNGGKQYFRRIISSKGSAPRFSTRPLALNNVVDFCFQWTPIIVWMVFPCEIRWTPSVIGCIIVFRSCLIVFEYLISVLSWIILLIFARINATCMALSIEIRWSISIRGCIIVFKFCFTVCRMWAIFNQRATFKLSFNRFENQLTNGSF